MIMSVFSRNITTADKNMDHEWLRNIDITFIYETSIKTIGH